MPKNLVLPVIRREDYPTFRRDIGPQLPKTYEEWSRLFAEEIAAARREGKTIVETVIDYAEFSTFCRAKGYNPDPLILLEFAKAQKPLGEA